MARFNLLTLLPWITFALAFPRPLMNTLNKRAAGLQPGVRLSRRAAAPPTAQFPYGGAKIDGLPGSQQGGFQVPAPGDTAHAFQPPPAGAERGPCPGLNTMANHGFISRDGITTFDELVAAQQNAFNIAYDLAVLLATLGIALDGDIITEKVSIGGDATAKTAALGAIQGLLGPEGGLDTHNTFEADTSLTRNDFFLANGDDYSFNGTLFAMMTETVASTSSIDDPLYDRTGIALYRFQRYQQSRAENEHFYFGPKATHIYGAASFLYQAFPSQTNNLKPDKETMMSFFGAVEPAAGEFTFGSQPERFPDNWFNRETPYTILEIATEILAQYLAHPVLFGGNVGPDDFDALGAFGVISNGQLGGNGSTISANDIACLLFQVVATEAVPDSVSGLLTLPIELLNWITGKLLPLSQGLGCPLATNS